MESNYGVHSREFEVGVLEWFGKFWDIEKEDMWGYVTNCGTEGNLHGILVGRECLPDAILYCSRASHYSVMKAARMYRMEPCQVNAHENGEIDLVHLRECLIAGKARGKSAVINVNVGTTVTGAVDNLDEVFVILKELGYVPCEELDSYDKSSSEPAPLGFFIHVDGALFGMMLPFLQEAGIKGPLVSFKRPIGSISVSGTVDSTITGS